MRTRGGEQAALEAVRAPRTTWRAYREIWRFVRTKPLGTAGAVIVACLLLVAVVAPWLAPYDPYEMHEDKLLVRPGGQFILGTDNLGRDLLSRIMFGSRVSLLVGFGSIALAGVAGAASGAVSAYLGGKFDMVTQRVVDVMMTFPTLILGLTIVAALGPSVINVIIAITLGETPRCTRTVRSAAMAVKESQYVESARAVGCSHVRTLFYHILPNCGAPWLIYVSAALASAIIVEATLSFLGLGVPPPTPSWGQMLSGAGRDFVQKAPWMAVYPGLAISAAVFGFNLLGDALRDVLDPRLR